VSITIPRTALAPAALDHVEGGGGPRHHPGAIDLTGDLLDAAMRPLAELLIGPGMDQVHRTGVSEVPQVRNQVLGPE